MRPRSGPPVGSYSTPFRIVYKRAPNEAGCTADGAQACCIELMLTACEARFAEARFADTHTGDERAIEVAAALPQCFAFLPGGGALLLPAPLRLRCSPSLGTSSYALLSARFASSSSSCGAAAERTSQSCPGKRKGSSAVHAHPSPCPPPPRPRQTRCRPRRRRSPPRSPPPTKPVGSSRRRVSGVAGAAHA